MEENNEMANPDAAKTILLVTGILGIITFIAGIAYGAWSLLSLLPLILDPFFGPFFMAFAGSALIMMVVFIVFGIFSLILGILCLRWKNNLPGGNTLLLWGIIGIFLCFGLGILVLVAHFVAGGDV